MNDVKEPVLGVDEQISGTAVKKAMDEALHIRYHNEPRDHLGASIIGRPCMREIWYSWRWANLDKPSARMIRLFDRGHKEEERFAEWLAPICKEFFETDPSTGKQFRVSDFHDYFGGSLDGIIVDPAGYEGSYLTEFKTHSLKSFEKVSAVGVKAAKPEHYTQMQIYLHYYPELKGALYMAVCKNDDSLYIEYVERDEKEALDALEKTRIILSSSEPPERMEKASEYNFYCKNFCNYSAQCWKQIAPVVTCRSCDFCATRKEGFTCKVKEKLLDHDEQVMACDSYERRF